MGGEAPLDASAPGKTCSISRTDLVPLFVIRSASEVIPDAVLLAAERCADMKSWFAAPPLQVTFTGTAKGSHVSAII